MSIPPPARERAKGREHVAHWSERGLDDHADGLVEDRAGAVITFIRARLATAPVAYGTREASASRLVLAEAAGCPASWPGKPPRSTTLRHSQRRSTRSVRHGSSYRPAGTGAISAGTCARGRISANH